MIPTPLYSLALYFYLVPHYPENLDIKPYLWQHLNNYPGMSRKASQNRDILLGDFHQDMFNAHHQSASVV